MPAADNDHNTQKTVSAELHALIRFLAMLAVEQYLSELNQSTSPLTENTNPHI